ncbi:MAG: mRNA surveillance protein pelota [Candidatus Woesearchaeota archaeon]
MKILKQDLKHGEITVRVETADDLWLLGQIVYVGDVVRGKTVRKIKFGDTETKVVSEKKVVFLALSAEKVEWNPETGLRVSGRVLEGPQDVPKGSWHTFDVSEGDTLTITKPSWPRFHLERLREAVELEPKVLLCLMDREEALFALLKKRGYELLGRIKGIVAKKAAEVRAKDFYKDIISELRRYDARFKLSSIIVASPAFWAEELLKVLGADPLTDKIRTTSCSSVDESAIVEVVGKPEIQEVLKRQKFARELRIVERFIGELSKGGKVCYGLDETSAAIEAGAVDTLLITTAKIADAKAQGSEAFEQLDKLMKQVEAAKGSVVVISSEHSGGQRIDGLGGIAALLRYKLQEA